MKYKRILLKLSGESLAGSHQQGINSEVLERYAEEIKKIVEKGCQISVVTGGGNIFRGVTNAQKASMIDRVQGDYMGMLATVINAMALQDALEKQNIGTLLMGGLEIEPFCAKFSAYKARKAMAEEGKTVIISGGTGNPFFTTDTAAALRAIEIEAEVILKGTRVEGIYTADPEKDPMATKYSRLSYREALDKKLKIMDLTAFTLCEENNMPIYVFNMDVEGNLLRVINGENPGTLVE